MHEHQPPGTRLDPRLAPLLAANDEAERESVLESILVEHVEPVAARVLKRFDSSVLSEQDVEDLSATVGLRFMQRVHDVDALARDPIERLEDYVATLTYNVAYDLLRRRHPERTRLKNRIRYVLLHERQLTSWQTPHGTVAAYARWKDRAAIERLEEVPTVRASASVIDAVTAILDAAGAPVLIDEIVRVLAQAWNLDQPRTTSVVAEPASDSTLRLESRQTLRALWNEIVLLPPAQRIALLLNLRHADESNAIALLVVSGVAGIDAIAAALCMSPEDLASIWNDLPLDDQTIASRLNLTRQQVINLRKAARKRLARRTKGSSG